MSVTTAPPLVRAPRGVEISCRGWPQEAALRMLMNNLDPEVAERPDDLVVYGGIGRAARNWDCYEALLVALKARGLQIADTSSYYPEDRGISEGVRVAREMAARVQ